MESNPPAPMKITSVITVEQTITSFPPGYYDAPSETPSTSSQSNSSAQSSANLPILAGAIGGGAVLLVAFLLTLWCCLRKRRMKNLDISSFDEKESIKYRDNNWDASLESYIVPKIDDSIQPSSRPWLSRNRISVSSHNLETTETLDLPHTYIEGIHNSSSTPITASVLIADYMDDSHGYSSNDVSDHPYNPSHISQYSDDRSSTKGILHHPRSFAGPSITRSMLLSAHIQSRNHQSSRFSIISSSPSFGGYDATNSMISDISFVSPIIPSPTGDYTPDTPGSSSGTTPLLGNSINRVRNIPSALSSGTTPVSSENLRNLQLSPAPPPRFSGLSRVAPPRSSTLTERLRHSAQDSMFSEALPKYEPANRRKQSTVDDMGMAI